jgi:heme/copper-type cytochrome/quinol oxidase subunit 4
MKDTLHKNEISIESFNITLIISEILVTAIVLYGFYLIFNAFNKKNKAFKMKNDL